MMAIVVIHPFFLWLLPLVALPVLFHLFARIRRRAMVFSTFMFFRRIDPLLNARRTIRQWLLLMLRALVILLLLLALARPLGVGAGAGGKTIAALVIDNSGSMNAAAGKQGTKLAEAAEAAEAVLASLNQGDAAALVLLVDDPAVPLPSGLSSDRAALKTAVRQIIPTEAAGTPGRALERAFALIETGTAAHYEIHVFSDLQETEWAGPAATLRRPRAGAALQFHRVAGPRLKEANVAVVETRVPEKRLIAGRRYRAMVRLQNTTAANADVRLNAEDDQGNKSVERVQVPAREARIVPLELNTETAGAHWKHLWVEGDGFLPDNRAALAFDCSERAAVLLVGVPAEFGVLPAALAPASDGALSGLYPVFAGAAEWEAVLAAKQPALTVVTWAALAANALSPQGLAALARYVEGGGNLLLVPSLSNPAAATAPEWIGVAAGAVQTAAAGQPVMIFQKGSAIFDDLRDAGGEVRFRDVRAVKFQPLRVAEPGEGLAGFENGQPLLAARRLGRGTIFASGLAFDPRWSNLPLKVSVLAIAQNLALCRRGGQAHGMALIAGQRLPGAAPVRGPVRIRSLTSTAFPLDWQEPVAELPGLPRAGVYSLETGTSLTVVAVSACADEAREAYLTGRNVPAAAGLSYSVEPYGGADELRARLKRSRTGMDFYTPLMLACLLALLSEGWLANQPPRGARAARRPERNAGFPQ